MYVKCIKGGKYMYRIKKGNVYVVKNISPQYGYYIDHEERKNRKLVSSFVNAGTGLFYPQDHFTELTNVDLLVGGFIRRKCVR